VGLDSKRAIINAIPIVGKMEGVRSLADLSKPEVKQMVMYKVREELFSGQTDIFAEEDYKAAYAAYDDLVTNYTLNVIEIPRIDLVLDEARA